MTQETTTYDVITLGETMLRLSPPGPLRLEQAAHYEAHVGGSESNVAVGLARLGLKTAWLSRMTDNALGRSVVNAIRAQGVDTQIAWTPQDRVGLYFYEAGSAPRDGQVIYDRAGSAAARMQPADLPQLQAHSARLLHLSGITPALGASAAETALTLARTAQAHGWQISLDVNYRQLLWSPQEARAGCHALAELADLLFLPLRDAVTLYQTTSDPAQAARQLRTLYPQATVILSLGGDGALALDDQGVSRQAAYPAEASGAGRIGGGDAFVAGYLYGHLTGASRQDRLRWGAACAAYKYSMPGDMPLLDRAPITQLIEDGHAPGLVR
jgi:2-dehydro-3-deoxygluconokinase